MEAAGQGRTVEGTEEKSGSWRVAGQTTRPFCAEASRGLQPWQGDGLIRTLGISLSVEDMFPRLPEDALNRDHPRIPTFLPMHTHL